MMQCVVLIRKKIYTKCTQTFNKGLSIKTTLYPLLKTNGCIFVTEKVCITLEKNLFNVQRLTNNGHDFLIISMKDILRCRITTILKLY